MKSKRLKQHYRILSYWFDGLQNANLKLLRTLGDAERVEMWAIFNLVTEINEKINGVYSKRIGDAVLSEMRAERR